MSEDGYVGSDRDLFEDSNVEDNVPDDTFASGVASSVSVGFSTPIKRRAKIVAPRVSRVAAHFKNSGGSLDRRWSEDSPDRYGFKSPAGDLALPASTTWSNNSMRRDDIREAVARKALPASTSWSNNPIGRDDVREAVARKGKRNNRYVAEQLVGRVTSQDDRAAEKRLGLGRGHFASKTWQNYGRKLGKGICGACYGACCSALRDFISHLEESHFIPAESQSPSVNLWLVLVLLLWLLFQDYLNAVRRLIWRFEC